MSEACSFLYSFRFVLDFTCIYPTLALVAVEWGLPYLGVGFNAEQIDGTDGFVHFSLPLSIEVCHAEQIDGADGFVQRRL